MEKVTSKRGPVHVLTAHTTRSENRDGNNCIGFSICSSIHKVRSTMCSDDRLVTVVRYDSRGDAQVAKTRLDDADIPCMLSNTEHSGLGMMFDASRSGVQVKVPAGRAEEARALLGVDE